MTGSASSLGELPEWDLKDLYESGQSEAFLRDFRRAEEEARRFALSYQGKLEAIAKEAQGGRHVARHRQSLRSRRGRRPGARDLIRP